MPLLTENGFDSHDAKYSDAYGCESIMVYT